MSFCWASPAAQSIDMDEQIEKIEAVAKKTWTVVIAWVGGITALIGFVASVVRHTDRRLFNAACARETFSRMSFAFAVQMNGFGLALCLSIY